MNPGNFKVKSVAPKEIRLMFLFLSSFYAFPLIAIGIYVCAHTCLLMRVCVCVCGVNFDHLLWDKYYSSRS